VGSAMVSETAAVWCAVAEFVSAPLPAPMRRIVLALARDDAPAPVT
jgi:hypothetical protein